MPNLTTINALKTNHSLPDAVVLTPLPTSFTQRFCDSEAVWLCAEPDLLEDANDTETSPDWHARCGNVIAVPARPNMGHSQGITLAGISCLAFQPQVNCGYCIPDAISETSPFSIAVIYAPSIEHEPRSLVTINPKEDDNYLFLSERDGAIELTDKAASFSLRHPITQDCKGFRLVVISYANGVYSLAEEGRIVKHSIDSDYAQRNEDAQRDTSGMSDLFIGCRSHRKGILKTLGKLSLADVFLWQGKDILAPGKAASNTNHSPEYNLLLQYYSEVILRDI